MKIMKKGKKTKEKRKTEVLIGRKYECENCGCTFELEKKDVSKLEVKYSSGEEGDSLCGQCGYYCEINCPSCQELVVSQSLGM